MDFWTSRTRHWREQRIKSRNRFLDWLGYAGLRILVLILSLFRVKRRLKIACFLGGLLWDHYERGRNRAMENLKASYPEKEPGWHEKIGKRSFEQITMFAMDMLFTPRLVRKDNWREITEFKNIERVKWMLHEKKGVILVTAHYGNFEIMGYLMGLFDFDLYSIARPLDNPYINKWLYGVRQRHGQKIIDKHGATKQMPDILRQGSALGFIADQDAGRKGVFVDFFGRKASTYKSIGLLAITNNMPIVVGYSRRIGNEFRFEMCVNRIIEPQEWQDKDDPLYWITQEYSRAIENFIREDPTQYWWLHRRWKNRPKEEMARTI